MMYPQSSPTLSDQFAGASSLAAIRQPVVAKSQIQIRRTLSDEFNMIPSPAVTDFGDTLPIRIPSTVLMESRTVRDVTQTRFEQQQSLLRRNKKG